ncbi:hypothetical protein R1flu_015720 [Riccia fluitans]|uniref:FAD synthase n=1 Tax=Riccia fluitans TaxID=41844 RepID=A0ABD1YKT2_9MARC
MSGAWPTGRSRESCYGAAGAEGQNMGFGSKLVFDMDIWNAVAVCGDKRLQAKFKLSMNVIERTLTLYGCEEVAFSFNGGKDSTVLLHLLRAGYAVAESQLASRGCAEEVRSKSQHRIRTIYFESPDVFPEIDTFTLDTAKAYDLELELIRLDFKSGLVELQKKRPMRAVFLGTRSGDPNAVGQEQFSPSSAGWPAFMRVNPILDWSYRDVWAFLLACKVPYCSLYDQGYTSIGSIHDTVPNVALCTSGANSTEDPASEKIYRPAYMLRDGRLERAGRVKNFSSVKSNRSRDGLATNGDINGQSGKNGLFAAAVLVVGDEILRGEVDDTLGAHLSKELHSIGWTVARRAVLPNNIDAISEEVEHRASDCDLVLMTGGVGTFHCDVTLAGVAKAFGARLAPDEELEEDLRRLYGENCPGDENKMAQLPEGITELLNHKNAAVPVIRCKNVYVLSAVTTSDLALQWNCLLEQAEKKDLFHAQQPFTSVRFRTSLPEVELARPLARTNSEFPDLTIGCYRESRQFQLNKGADRNEGQLIISIVGKDPSRVNAAAKTLALAFPEEVFSEIRS